MTGPRAGLRTVGAVLLVAAGYFISGRLGLLLAIPPGYATAVWPASGIALAATLFFGYRIWPGIWLGSFLINVGTSLNTDSTAALALSLLVPACIATGAVLHAVVGAILIQRWVGYNNLLTQEMQAVKILLLGGPVACVLSASVGVGTLWLRGFMPTSGVLLNWWTWWIGDSIGVLIFTPLLLVWSARPSSLWLRRQIYASVPLVLVFLLVVWLFVFVSRNEQQRLHASFSNTVAEFQVKLQRDAQDYLNALHSLQGFYDSTAVARHEGFTIFAGRLQARLPALQALSWNAHVPVHERARFEAELGRRLGQSGFSISEKTSDGHWRPAPLRDDYYPVQFIVPLSGNESALGFNTASDPVRWTAMRRAAEQDRPMATAPVQLVQETGHQPGVLIYLPVYSPGRVRTPTGYVAAVLRMGDLLSSVLAPLHESGIALRLYDDSDGAAQLLWDESPDADKAAGGLYERVALDFAGRHWVAEMRVPATYLLQNRSWETWTLLATGMLFTGLLGMFLLVMIGRSAVVEAQVTERTAELKRVNGELLRETERRERLEAEANQRARELAASNHELEQFAYVASHDLQAPLRTIASFVGLLEQRYTDRLNDEARHFLSAIRSGCGEMRELIEGLLSLSQLNQPLVFSPVAMTGVVDRACAALHSDLKVSAAEVLYKDLPTVQGDARLMVQLLQNLIGNAIKFQPEGQAPRVRVTAVREGQNWRFSVLDNGIGIPADRVDQLFLMFRRLHRAQTYRGNGIGLALCRKIVRLHQGRIWAEPRAEGGSVFHFTLPAATG